MSKIRHTLFVYAASVALAMLTTGTAWSQDTIRIATPYPVTTLDPAGSAAGGNNDKFPQLYSTLLRYDDDGNLAPALAESWEVSDDGMKITLQLREAGFSDGSPITADDVVFSLQRTQSDQSAYPAPVASIDAVTAEDEHTVVLELKHPHAPILANLTIYNTGIVSRAAVEGNDDAFASDPVTSGPYTVKQWAPNDRLVLEANPHYWREGYPRNDGAVFIEVGSANTRIDMLVAGKVDAVRSVPWTRIDKLADRDDTRAPLNPTTLIYETLLNHDRAPFDNEKVRRAAALALNRAAIANAVTFGHSEVANTTLTNAIEFHNNDFDELQYDPDQARQLLQEAGAENPQVTIITTQPEKKAVTLIQAQWAEVGIDASIDQVDTGNWWKRLMGGDYDATVNWFLNETRDPDLATRWALCGECGNRSYYTNYNNEQVNELIDKAARAQDVDQREQYYHEIQRISTHEVSQIPLYYPAHNIAYSTRIEGLKMTPYVQWTLESAEVVE